LIEKFPLTWTKQNKEHIKCRSVNTSFQCQTPWTFVNCSCCHCIPISNGYKHNNFLIQFTNCRVSLYYTYIVSIAIGVAQKLVKIVCERSTRVICRSSRFPVCLMVRILRIVRNANMLSTITGSRRKITGTWKYVYSNKKTNMILFRFCLHLHWS